MISVKEALEAVAEKFVSIELPCQSFADDPCTNDYGIPHSDSVQHPTDYNPSFSVSPGGECYEVQQQTGNNDHARNNLYARQVNEGGKQQSRDTDGRSDTKSFLGSRTGAGRSIKILPGEKKQDQSYVKKQKCYIVTDGLAGGVC